MEEKNKNNATIVKKTIAIICGMVIIITGIHLCYTYYHEYNGDYQTARYCGNDSSINKIVPNERYKLISSYEEYTELIKKANSYGWQDIEYKYDSVFFENNSLVFVEILHKGFLKTKLISLKEHNNSVNIKIYVGWNGGLLSDVTGILYFMPVSKNASNSNIEYVYDSTFEKENITSAIIIFISAVGFFITFRKKKENGRTKRSILKIVVIIIVAIIIIVVGLFALMVYYNAKNTVRKPIIYLYPTEDTVVSVKLGYSSNITVSYPQYTTGWNVLAKSNGDLIDLSTNKNLYSLYYESESSEKFKIEKDGFVVKGEDSVAFLEEKLAILGLNEREMEEFIIYWLPKLEANKYNYIRFATMDEINRRMPLEINPNPDTIIRVLMTYKGLNNPIEVKEQELERITRNGFVAVEWGGTEIK